MKCESIVCVQHYNAFQTPWNVFIISILLEEKLRNSMVPNGIYTWSGYVKLGTIYFYKCQLDLRTKFLILRSILSTYHKQVYN